MLQPKVSKEELALLHESLQAEARLSQNYIVLIVSSCLIATFGLISNSAAVIIGAMIIAPLMLPLRGLAFAALEANLYLFRSSLISIAVGTGVSVLLAGLIGRLIGIPEFGSEVLSRTQPNLVDLGIAVTAGSVSGFAKVRPKISDALAGTAIAVALMPPICVVGLLISQGDWRFGWGAFLLYLTTSRRLTQTRKTNQKLKLGRGVQTTCYCVQGEEDPPCISGESRHALAINFLSKLAVSLPLAVSTG